MHAGKRSAVGAAPRRRRGRALGARLLLVGPAAVALVAARRSLGFVCGPGKVDSSRGASRASAKRDPQVSVLEPGTDIKATVDIPAGRLRVKKADISDEISEKEFWMLVDKSQVREADVLDWSGKQLVAELVDGRYISVKEESDPEDLRDRLLQKGIRFRYPKVDSLSEKEILEETDDKNYTSEGPVAGGILAALAIGIADSAVELGGVALLTGGGLEGQSLLEGKGIQEVIEEDLYILNKDIRFLERSAQNVETAVENDLSIVQELAAKEVGGLASWFGGIGDWCQRVAQGLVANHAPGLGGVIEDAFMLLLTGVSLYSLWEMAFLKRKSNSLDGAFHTATGAMQIIIVVYAILEERALRESPGPVWAVATFIIFMINNITMWPLLKYFRGAEFQRVLFKLGYSFIISFQGIHAIAWSIEYEWLYWVVMPFWFYSVKKLAESSEYIFALLPEGTLPGDIQENSKKRLKGLQNDTPTLVYSILNFAGAVFDNLYMAVYTWRGPAGFWGWSAENIPAVNDHLRTGLVKPAFGSLTISVLVFLGTLVYRNKLSQQSAVVLNVILASVGPWLILYYHKLIDWEEPWQPEIMGDWGSTPYFVAHAADLGALLLVPLTMLGVKTLSASPVAPAVAEVLPEAAPLASAASKAISTAAVAGSEAWTPPPGLPPVR